MARHLVVKRLAACVSVMPKAYSVYHWKGELEETDEWLLLIKTSRANLEKLSAALQTVHSYQVPEIIAVQVVDGSAMYLDWMERELDPGISGLYPSGDQK